jgi:transposase
MVNKETLRMSRKERRRMVVLEQVKQGSLTLREACERMKLSYRQTRRVWKRFKRSGAQGLVHGSRDRISNRRLDEGLKRLALELYEAQYRDYGPTLASEVLADDHGVYVHRETLRRWLHAAHLYVPKRVARQHRKQRERRRRFGQLVQIDGSHHRWLEDRGEKSCLMVAIDDATGRSMALMSEEETTESAFELIGKWVARYGVPEAVYVDGRTLYASERDATPDEVRQGSGALTDFGRGCWRLGVEVIHARSPQAKGRVERRNGVLQDRFVKAMRRHGVSTIAGANAMIDGFMVELDGRFAVSPLDPLDAHRHVPSPDQLADALCWEQTRSVQGDWTITYGGRRYQIARQSGQPHPRQRVTVRRRLDQSLAIVHHGQTLRFTRIGDP